MKTTANKSKFQWLNKIYWLTKNYKKSLKSLKVVYEVKSPEEEKKGDFHWYEMCKPLVTSTPVLEARCPAGIGCIWFPCCNTPDSNKMKQLVNHPFI